MGNATWAFQGGLGETPGVTLPVEGSWVEGSAPGPLMAGEGCGVPAFPAVHGPRRLRRVESVLMQDRGSSPEPARHIPWGYGKNRVTAMPVDPDLLYVYWEITDAALDAARSALGQDAAEARLILRVYDVTGRIFDGTNAHGSFDISVDRSDRQWFVPVHRPASSAIVEIGLRTAGGTVRALARSRRVEFPRRAPVPFTEPEWGMARTVLPREGDAHAPRLRLETPSSPLAPKKNSSPATTAGGSGRTEPALPERGAGGGSEERLGGEDRPRPGGASEKRPGGTGGKSPGESSA